MPFLCRTVPFSLHLFDTTPSPHGRISAPSLLLAFAHIHGEAGTPTFGHLQCSGGSDRSVSMCRRGGFYCHFYAKRPHSRYIYLTPPRLRTGESVHLVCFWPSPTSMARREHQLWASAVQWWVGPVRFYVQKGWIFTCHLYAERPHSRYIYMTPPRLRTGESVHLVCFWPSPTSMARRKHQCWASTVQWWVGPVRFYVQKGWTCRCQQTAPFSLHLFDTTPSPHGRINAPSLLLAFAYIHGEAGTPTWVICSAVVGRTGPFLCAEGVDFIAICMPNGPILATLDTTPSPHGRISAPSLLLAFAHIHGEAGTPTFGHLQCSGGSDRSVSMCRRGGY
jgi:hypothetical protein